MRAREGLQGVCAQLWVQLCVEGCTVLIRPEPHRRGACCQAELEGVPVKLPERPPLDLPCHSLVSSMFGVTAVCQAQGLVGSDQETCPVELCPGEVERSGG